MEGVDKEKVKKIVFEMSQGSAFFANQQRREAALREKVTAMQAARDRLTPARLAALEEVSCTNSVPPTSVLIGYYHYSSNSWQ